MELIYMFIKNFGHEVEDDQGNKGQFIVNKELNFSDRFNINYITENGNLYIEKKENIYPNFYGKSIRNIKMLVGQNGSGKTTILDILGMNRSDRIDESFIRKHRKFENINGLKAYNSEDDMSYFKDEYIIVYLLQYNDNLNECIFGMEVIGNFHKDGFIKNLVTQDNTFYKLPIGFVFQYDDYEKIIYATQYHLFNSIDPETQNLTYNSFSQNRILNKICEDCNFFYIAHSFSHRIRYNRPLISKRKEDQDDEYLMKRFYRRLTMEGASDYKSGYSLLQNKEYKEFRKRIFNFSPRINLSHTFIQRDVLPTITIEEQRIKTNYEMLMNYLVNELSNQNISTKKDIKQVATLSWIDAYIIDGFTNLLEASFEKEHIKTILDVEFLELDKDVESNVFDMTILENLNQGLVDTSSLGEIEDIYSEFLNMFSIIKKVNGLNSDINVTDDVLRDFFDLDMNQELSRFHYNVYLKILISRYVFSRLGLKFDIIKEGAYQVSVEDVFKKIMKLDKVCFIEDKQIYLTYGEKIEKNVIDLLNTMEKYSNIDYCDIDRQFTFELQDLSDGEKAIFIFFSKVITSLRGRDKNSLNIFLLDEPDAFLHPQWAKEFMNQLFKAVEAFTEEINQLNVQFIISTHSPFLLSDIRAEDVLLLEHNSNIESNKQFLKLKTQTDKTFGANIHSMLKQSFFMNNTIGDFAKHKIDEVIKFLLEENGIRKNRNDYRTDPQKRNKYKYIIDLIGEPVIKNKLEEMYNDIFLEDLEEEQLTLYKDRILKLKDVIVKSNISNKDNLLNLKENLSDLIDNIDKIIKDGD